MEFAATSASEPVLARNSGRADLNGAQLERADLRRAALDKKTHLDNGILTDVRLDGVIFDNTNLSVVDWSVCHACKMSALRIKYAILMTTAMRNCAGNAEALRIANPIIRRRHAPIGCYRSRCKLTG